jgi:hypothetical protein
MAVPNVGLPDFSNFNINTFLSSTVFGMPWLAIVNIIVGLIICIALIWFFTRRGKLKFHIQIYERDSSGIPIPLDTDILVEKVINKGKNTVYLLKKYQALAHPPISKFIYKRKKSIFGEELWCDYLRERQDFIPIQRLVELGVNTTEDMAEFTRRLVEIYKTKPEEARQKFIYSPIIPIPIARLKYEPMDYNMTEMLQVRLAQREMLYSDRQGFLQQYGPVIGIGLAAVCIIVVAFLAFQFASTSISSTTSAANAVAEKLGGVIASIQNSQLANP